MQMPESKASSTSCGGVAEQVQVPRNLELLNRMKKKLSDLDLSNTLILSVQHLCSTTESLFHALLDAKLPPENLYVLGKCYSTNPVVSRRLIAKGIKVSPSSSIFDSAIPFDVAFDRHIKDLIKQVLSEVNLSSYEKIIILDDGGHLIEAVNKRFPSGLPLVGIEQTSSGFNRTRDSFFPIINLARSWLKLEKESPIIIDLVLRKLREKISNLSTKIENVLIIGKGVLGTIISKTLSGKYRVSIYDIDPEKSSIPASDFKRALGDFDLILGCTGNTSLQFEEYHLLKKPVVLASISSSDREFEAYKLRQSQPKRDCHENVLVNDITLLNCGFPITFDSDYDSIDTDNFQLTRTLIFASIYQAFETNPCMHGFIGLEDHLQNYILMEMKRL